MQIHVYMRDLQNENGAEMKRRTCINVNESQAHSGDETSSSQAKTSKTSAATKKKKKEVQPEVPEFLVE